MVTSCGTIDGVCRVVSFHRSIASWQPSPGHCSCVWGFADVLGVMSRLFPEISWMSLFPSPAFIFQCYLQKLQVADWAFSTFPFISFCINVIFIVFFLTREAAFVRQGTHSLRQRAKSCVMRFQGSGRRKPTFSILSRQKPSTRRCLQLFPLK